MGQSGNVRADQTAINLPLGEDGVGRSRDVQKKNKEQRPKNRTPRRPDTGRGVVTRQNVRQSCRSDHQNERKRNEVVAGVVAGGPIDARVRLGVGRWVGRPRLVLLARAFPFDTRFVGCVRQIAQRPLGGGHIAGGGPLSA